MYRSALVVWERGAGFGHYTRLLPIVEHLVHTGYICEIVVKRPHDARKVIDQSLPFACGRCQFHALPAFFQERERQPHPVRTLADLLTTAGFDDEEYLDAAIANWIALVARIRPSFAITDFSPLAGLLLRGRIPLLVVGTGYSIPPQASNLPVAGATSRPVPSASVAAERRVLSAVATIAQRHGLRAPNNVSELLHGDITLGFCIPELDPYREIRESPLLTPYNIAVPDDLIAWRDRPHRTALAYLPFAYPHLEQLVEAFLSAGFDARISIPGVESKTISRDRGRVVLSPKLHNLATVMPWTRIMVHQGGLGVATASLWMGTPQLLFPANREQEIYVEAILRLRGGAVVTGRSAPADILASALIRLAEDTTNVPDLNSNLVALRRAQMHSLDMAKAACRELSS